MLCDTFLFCGLLYKLRKHILNLLVNLGQIAVQLT